MLSVQNLGFRYGDKAVIQDVDLRVNRGAILSLVGPNGAGKTTLMKCINRLLEPTHGSIEWNGIPISRLSRLELARTMAYVPQAEPLRFPMTVFDTILLGRRPYLNWRPGKIDIDIVYSMIERLELEELTLRDMNELSGGERQKVIIAKALAQEPQLLLFDEPNTYLDLKYQLTMMQLIRDLVDEKQISAMMITHDLNLALRFSDQLAMLDKGHLVAEGGPDILTEELIRQVYEVNARIRQEGNKPFMVPIASLLYNGNSMNHDKEVEGGRCGVGDEQHEKR